MSVNLQKTVEASRRVVNAGTMIFVGAVWLVISIVVAEALTPGYDVSREAVSGLGSPFFSATCTQIPGCLAPIQPASMIFVLALFLSGALFLWSALLLRKAFGHRRFSFAFTVVGGAWILVAISYVPIYMGFSTAQSLTVAAAIHFAGAIVIFILPPILAISAFKFTRPPFRYLSVALGLVSLAALLLLSSSNWLGLGLGGIERLLLYPIFLWLIGFGAYLFGGLEVFGIKSSSEHESSEPLAKPSAKSSA